MKIAIVVAFVLASVILQVSSVPNGESATAEAAADVGTTALQFTGGCTFHALIAQFANFVTTVAPKETITFSFCTAILDRINDYKAGKITKLDVVFTNLIKGKDSISGRIATLIVAITAPNISWRDIQIYSLKVISIHYEYYRNIIHEFFAKHKIGIFNDIYKFLQNTFSNCPKN